MHAPWLHDPTTYGDVRFVAVGIARTGRAQVHAALFYRGIDGALRALHFCWDHAWSDELAPDCYYWVTPAVRSSVARSLAALCRLVADQRPLDQVPFAFRYDNRVVFDPATGQLLGPRGEGLTCASFVLAMFASINIRLVEVASWSSRRCDAWWQARILRLAHGTHAERLRAQWGSIRFRPEEVVAAANQTSRPVRFATAVEDGREVLYRLGMSVLGCWHG